MENLTKKLVSIKKLRSFPIFNYTCGYLSKLFNGEERPTIVEVTKRVGEVVLSFADEISLETEVEEQLLILDELAAKGLCTLEENFPFITNKPDQILELLKEFYVGVLHKAGSVTTEMKSSTSDKLEQIICKINFPELLNTVEKEGEDLLELAEYLVELLLPPIDELEHNVRVYNYLMMRSTELLVTALKRVLARTDVKKVLTILIATFPDMPLVARSFSFILCIYVILTEYCSTS